MGRRRSVRHTSFSELTENFERLNVQTETEAAEAAQHASERWPSAPIINPFAPQQLVQPPPTSSGASDVSMTDVSMPVLNAPNLPAAPVYRGSTFEERRAFMRQYEAYTIVLSAFQTPSNRPFVMPVIACIEGNTRRRIAMFEFGCAPEQITDEQWVNYFLEANVPVGGDNYLIIDEAMKSLHMNLELKEAQSRMNRLQSDMYKILEAHNLGEEMFAKAPRRIVGYMLEALQPAGFREIVRQKLTMESNKAMKKQIVPFCKWVTTMLAQYMQWNDEARAQKPSQDATLSGRQPRGKTPPPKVPGAPQSTASASTKSEYGTIPTSDRKRPVLPCLQCASSEHSVRHCPKAQPGEADKLIAEAREKKRSKQIQAKKLSVPLTHPPVQGSTKGSTSGHVLAVADGLEVKATLLDSGSDDTLISRAAVEALPKVSPDLDVQDAQTPAIGESIGKQLVVLSRTVVLHKVSLATSAGPLILRNLRCWVDESDDELNITIGRPMMERLGYSVVSFLVAALSRQTEYDGGGNPHTSPAESPLLKMQRLQYQTCYDPPSSSELTPLEEFALTPKFEDRDEASERVQQLLAKGLKDAVARGLSERGLHRMRASLDKYTDNFRVQFGLDPPVKVEPLKVRLKPGAVPVKCKSRRYSLLHRIFLDAHVKELLDAMLIRENNRSRWCLPPRIVPKKDVNELGMTIDTRAVNACTEAMPFPMPQLEVVITHVEGATVFFSCDWFKGYWQLPLDPESQELYTFMTHRGMYTPSRVPMGATDSVAFCQQTVEEIFHDEINHGVLAWLDDLLGYAASEEELCDLFDLVMRKCSEYGLKLHPGKCVFFTKSIKWCGRVISAAGVTHCPERIQGLVDMPPPNTAADLQQLLYASAEFWGAVATQVPPGDLDKPRESQRHEPLAFLSGKFVGAASRWAIVEKEAFAIVEACQRLDYILLRPGGFKLFTDHRNLVYLFNPYAVDAGIHRYQADKLQRWALGLASFNYEIEHVSGDDNVWGDLLSRWGASIGDHSASMLRLRQLVVVDQVAPLQQPDFEWPTSAEIRSVQDDAVFVRVPVDVALDEDSGLYMTNAKRIWLPDDAGDLHQRVCVIGHAGACGHRGVKATLQAVKQVFYWKTMQSDIDAFVRGCIHCLSTSNSREPRPFGPTLRATRPNEVLHFDFLSLPVSSTGQRYVLVLKDGMSGYTELVACTAATAEETATALMDWFKRFGIVHQWVSDQGSHFKNQLIERLRRLFGAQHHFVTAYCPWANGSVEVVNRMVLKAMKALLSEHKLPTTAWPSVLPVVQYSLNSMPSDRLGMIAPLTVFTGLPGTSQLSAIVKGEKVLYLPHEELIKFQQQNIADVRCPLEAIHQDAAATSAKKTDQRRDHRNRQVGVKMPNFELGDFVLTASVLPRRNKLALLWQGPKRIVAAINDYTFQVQDLVAPYAITVHHASRMKFYRDSQREVTEDLLDHVHHGAGGHLVEKLLDCRKGPDDFEIKVQWVGLDPLEASWEPARVIIEDIPKLVQAYVVAHPKHKVLQSMWRVLGENAAPTQRKRGGK